MEDIILLKYIGANPILVHGGGPDITAELKQHNIESKFINGLRVTDEATVKVAQMTLVGKTNKEIVALVNKLGGSAIGVCGIDGNLIKCKKLTHDEDGNPVDIGYVGDIVSINNKLLELLTSGEDIPVVATVNSMGLMQGASYTEFRPDDAATVSQAVKLILTVMGYKPLAESKGGYPQGYC